MEKSQTPAGKISIGLQLGRASLETRNLSLGCVRFFRLALLTVLDPLYLLRDLVVFYYGLLRGWSLLRGIIQQYFTISVHLKSGLISGMAFNECGLKLVRGGLLSAWLSHMTHTQSCASTCSFVVVCTTEQYNIKMYL